jgi:small subunit ribosomal protein S9
MAEEPETPAEETPDTPAEDAPAEETPAEETPVEEAPVEETASPDEPVAEEAPAAEVPAETAEEPAPEAAPEEPAPAADEAPAAEEAPATDDAPAADTPPAAGEAPRAKPEIPGADLEVDIVLEGSDPLAQEGDEDSAGGSEDGRDEADVDRPVAQAAIDLAADARYKATGKRKTAVARVIVKPGSGSYTINGRTLEQFFPRPTLERNIRQPLEAVGYEARMDVVASLKGGGTSAQAGALRHGIARALIEADPNLRGELKRRGFLTRDPRKKERKKAGLKKARKRPQFSKR